MSIEASAVAAAIAGLNFVLTVGGGFFFMGRVTARLDAYDANTKRVEKDVSEMKGLLISAAVEADRLRRAEADIENVENDLRNLRRGVGWIKDANARSVEREY